MYQKSHKHAASNPLFMWLPALTFVGIVVWCLYNGNSFKRSFYRRHISSKVIGSNLKHGRYVEFKLEDGTIVDFLPPTEEKIAIGDSVQKDSGTFIFYVYRLNSAGFYTLLNDYDITRAL